MNRCEEAQTPALLPRWAGLTAKEVMTTPVVTVAPEATILEAIRLLLANSISGMPVVDNDGGLVGIVTEKDLLVGAHLLQAGQAAVSLVMTRHVVTVGENASLDETTQILVHRGFKRLPVMKNGRLTGIVARRDVLRSIQSAKLGH